MSGLVSIIILAWNQLEYTKQCINSILIHTQLPYELILVDNGSGDGTLQYFLSIKEATVIHNPQNQGYARGNNQGIRRAKGDYILLLNNDTIVTHCWLKLLIHCINSNPKFGAVAPRSNFAAVTGYTNQNFKTTAEMQTYARFHNRCDPQKWFYTEWLPGFCLLIRRSVIEEKVGLLDEKFNLGLCEDVDLCRRISRAGYQNVCAGDTFVFHYGSRTFIGQNIDTSKLNNKNSKYLVEKWSSPDRM